MPRSPDPWKWEAREGWYAWIKGKRVRLASFADGINKAKKRLRELIAEAEAEAAFASVEAPAVPLVGELVADYLLNMKGRARTKEVAAQTKGDAARRMAGFAAMHGMLPADQIRPRHVADWLETHPEWGPTSRHDGVGAVKAVFRWAARQGRIERNPIADMEKPKRKTKRGPIPTAEEMARFFAAIRYPELLDLLTFIYATGCRPKEARTMEARHLDRAGGRAVMPEHKTAHKTGEDRVIYMPPRASEIAYRLADLHPAGPIFLNSRKKPWTTHAVVQAVETVKLRSGVGNNMVAYAFRHGFVTDGLERKVSPAIMAELVGHKDLRMMGTYSHLSDRHDSLREAAEQIRGEKPPES